MLKFLNMKFMLLVKQIFLSSKYRFSVAILWDDRILILGNATTKSGLIHHPGILS